jgi:hypothetical protein
MTTFFALPMTLWRLSNTPAQDSFEEMTSKLQLMSCQELFHVIVRNQAHFEWSGPEGTFLLL